MIYSNVFCNIINIMKTFLKNLFPTLKKILIVLLKLFFCLFFTILVGYWVALIGTLGSTDIKNLNWQIIFYIGLGIVLIFGVWINSFFKIPSKIKILFIILFFIWLFSPFFLHSVMQAINEDTCIDTGICAEGVKFGDDVISKEYCLKKGKKWDENKKSCNLRD
jgi:hypothetical protein